MQKTKTLLPVPTHTLKNVHDLDECEWIPTEGIPILVVDELGPMGYGDRMIIICLPLEAIAKLWDTDVKGVDEMWDGVHYDYPGLVCIECQSEELTPIG